MFTSPGELFLFVLSFLRFLLALGCLAAPAIGHCEYFVQSWNVDDALPDNNVRGIVQTKDGYLWLATHRGLARFDGSRFKFYTPANTPCLSDQNVLSLFSDDGERLWIGLPTGLVLFENGRWKIVKRQQMLFRDAIAAIAGARGALFCAMDGDRVLRYADGRLNPLESAQFSENDSDPELISNGEQAWLASGGLLARLEDRALVPIVRKRGERIRATLSKTGELWYVSSTSLFRCSSDGVSSEVVALPPGISVRKIMKDSKGILWIGTRGQGLYYFKDGEFREAPTVHGTIVALFEDREGNVWAGTDGDGLNRVSERPLGVIRAADGLNADAVSSIAMARDGSAWVVTNEGSISIWDGEALRKPPSSLLSVRATCVAISQDGCKWIGTGGNGLYRLCGENLRRFNLEDGLPSMDITILETGPNGDLYVGGTAGVSKLAGEHFEVIRTLDFTKEGLRCLCAAKDGVLWAGAGDGSLHSLRDGKHERFGVEQGLSGAPLRCILAEEDGTLWIGSHGGGICRWVNGKGERLGKDEGLWDDSIIQIQNDGAGNLWCGTPRGVFRVSTKELKAFFAKETQGVEIETYGRAEGLESFACSLDRRPNCAKMQDGRMLFATLRGVIIVDPAAFKTRVSPELKVVIEETRVNGKVVKPDDNAPIPGVIGIAPLPREMEIRYSAPDFTAPEKLLFRYRLLGLDDQWSKETSSRSATYHALSPGAYRFQVMARFPDHAWPNSASEIAFLAPALFWQTAWFRAAEIVVGVALIVWMTRALANRRVRLQLRLAEAETAVERERIRLARDMHDEVGAGLTQIAMLTGLIAEDHGASRMSAGHIRKLNAAALNAIRSLDEIVWAVNPGNDTLRHLIDYAGHYAAEYLELAGIAFELDFPPDLPDIRIDPELRRNLLMGIKEAVHNVVKHAEATAVTLQCTITADGFSIRIEDNGRGFQMTNSSSQPYRGESGDGLRNLSARMMAIGGQFRSESAPGEGVAVSFNIKRKR